MDDGSIPVEVSSVEIEIEIEDEPQQLNKVVADARYATANKDDSRLSASRAGKKLAFAKELYDLTTNLPVPEDIRHGYKMLQHLMAPSLKKVNSIFMSSFGPDNQASSFHSPGTRCLTLPEMKEKFEDSEYASLTEFMKDVRDMFLVYIRYHGPEHSAAGLCEKLETILQQRVALLPRAYKEMCTLESTHRSYLKTSEWSMRSVRQISQTLSLTLIQRLLQEAKEMGKEEKKRQLARREKNRESLKHELACWESTLFGDNKLEQMLSSWELPQIGLFLYLCQTPLNCGTMNQCEVERMMLLCKESKAMARVMTSLLSTPHQRQYLDRRPPMPYHVWSVKLCDRLQAWYKILTECSGDHSQAAEIIGIEAMFWQVVGKLRNPLVRKPFHELTFFQRIWTVKSLCDSCTSSQASLREAIEEQTPEDTRAFVLGTDGAGATYINFPQFCGDSLRVYRIRTKKKAGRKRVNQEAVAEEPSRATSPVDVCSVLVDDTPSLPTSRLSPSPSNQPKSTKISRAERLARRSVKFEDWRAFKYLESTSSRGRRNPTIDSSLAQPVASPQRPVPEPYAEPLSSHSEPLSANTHSTPRQISSSELKQTDDTNFHINDRSKQSNMSSPSDANHGEPEISTVPLQSGPDQENSLCNMYFQEEVDKKSSGRESTCGKEAIDSQSHDNSTAISVQSSDSTTSNSENVVDSGNIKSGSPVVTSDPDPVTEVVPEDGLLLESPDMESYRLVCQSVEDLKNLCSSFEGSRGKELELHAELEKLVEELTPFELKLTQLEQKSKEGLRREQESYSEPTDPTHNQKSSEWDTEGEDEDSMEEDETVGDCREYVTTGQERRQRRERRAEAAAAQELDPKEAELGESLFGRRRKRRVIPNNAVTELFSKRPRKEREVDAAAGIKDNTKPSNAVTQSPVSTSNVEVPEGFVMVKIEKEMYLVRKEQLPALLTKTSAMHVQIVTQAVKVVNPKAVNTIQSSHTPTSCQTRLATSQRGTQLHTQQQISRKAGVGDDRLLRATNNLKTNTIATDLPNTLFTVGRQKTANPSLKFTLNSSSDPLGFLKENTVRHPKLGTRSPNLVTASATSILTSSAGTTPTSVSIHITKPMVTESRQTQVVTGSVATQKTSSTENLTKEAQIIKMETLPIKTDTQHLETEPSIMETEARLVEPGQKFQTDSPLPRELRLTSAAGKLVEPGQKVQTDAPLPSEIRSTSAVGSLHAVTSHIMVKTESTILDKPITSLAKEGLPTVTMVTSKQSLITSPGILPLREVNTRSAPMPAMSHGKLELSTTTIQMPSSVGTRFQANRATLAGVMPRPIVSAPRAWTVVRCTSNSSVLHPVKNLDVACRSISAPLTSEPVSVLGSAVVQRGKSTVTMRSHPIVASQEKRIVPRKTIVSSQPAPRPVFLLTQPKTRPTVVGSSSVSGMTASPIRSIARSQAKTVTTVSQATAKLPQLMVSSQILKHVPGTGSSGIQTLRLVNGVPQVNTVSGTMRTVLPANASSAHRVGASLQNGTFVRQQNTKGKVIHLSAANHLRVSATNQLTAGTERLVLVKKPNGSCAIPSTVGSIRSLVPTQIVLSSQSQTSNPTGVNKSCGTP